ncbi:MAG: hypothetical protein EOP88_21710 [Verrucomicrobiaceae bacterium]|nr:MAG: hypothetical protein EOP88_21710 [Verrucomicrobiaceae bacterium]
MIDSMGSEEIYFTSSRFQIEEGEEEDTNPGRYGKQLGIWLCECLKSRGYPEAEVFPEDWGWCVMCNSKPFMLWIGCGSMLSDEVMKSTSSNPPSIEKIVWTAFPRTEIPFYDFRALVLKLIGKIQMEPARQKLLDDLWEILSAASDIHFVDRPV